MDASRVGAETIRDAVTVGVLATATMDAAMLGAALVGQAIGREGAFSSERLSPQIIGRWAVGLLRGRMFHEDISTEPPIAGELAMGMAAHYATGVALTAGFLVATRLAGHEPRPRPRLGLAYGFATSVFPLFLMFPSMGYGLAGTRSGEAGRMTRTMLVGHLGFGAGIACWTRRLTPGR